MFQIGSLLLGSLCSVFAYQSYKIGYRLLPYWTKPSQMLNQKGYVIVSGATGGIGKAFLLQLNKLNIKVIAFSPNMTQLQKLKQEIPQTLSVQAKFTERSMQRQESKEISDQLEKILKEEGEEKVIGIVNTAGLAHFSLFDTLTKEEIDKIHNANINSLHFMLNLNANLQSSALLAKKPFFINISSITAQEPHQYSTVYAASKAYTSNLINGVSQEHPNITFLDVRPWFVKTKMVSYQDTWDTASPQQIAEGSLRNLGKRLYCSGCYKHELLNYFSWLFEEHFEKNLQKNITKMQQMKELLKKKREGRDK